MVNLLIALSLGVHLEQLGQGMGLTWPLFLGIYISIFLPPLNRFTTPELDVLGSSLFHHDFGISGSCRFWGS
jgi:hypothetical protein